MKVRYLWREVGSRSISAPVDQSTDFEDVQLDNSCIDSKPEAFERLQNFFNTFESVYESKCNSEFTLIEVYFDE